MPQTPAAGAAPSRPVALVTGAGTGIGRATVKALHGAGYRVVLAGRRQDRLQRAVDELADELGDEPGDGSGGGTGGGTAAAVAAPRALAVACDVGDPASVQALFERIAAVFGRLDLLFNNAGSATPPVPLEDLTYQQWTGVVNANLTGAFLCTQGAFRLMKQQTPRGGRIINNGSISAHAPRPRSAPYTATKHAITGLTKATALDGRAYDIACGQIDIGNAATEMTERMATGVLQAEGSVRVEPRMAVDQVARAVLYMASLPLDANVLFMTVMATQMPFVGRG
ncbi:MAG TPA: SDR family oxidoreductase [Burkholderiaceae bacterium]